MKKLVLLTFVIIPIIVSAQVSLERQVIASGGSHLVSGNLQLSTTIGEPVVATSITGTIILTQGFQQSETQIVGFEIPELNVDVLAYPNPTGHSVTLRIGTDQNIDFNIEFMDMTGRIVLPPDHITVNNQIVRIYDFSGLAAGNYLISLKSNNQLFESIKIQKIN